MLRLLSTYFQSIFDPNPDVSRVMTPVEPFIKAIQKANAESYYRPVGGIARFKTVPNMFHLYLDVPLRAESPRAYLEKCYMRVLYLESCLQALGCRTSLRMGANERIGL